MKIFLLHLSDIHFQSDSNYPEEKIGKIANTIPVNDGRNTVIILVTGDLAFSGEASQYSFAKRMLEQSVSSLIVKGYSNPRVLFVPGNHDISLTERRTFSDIQRQLKENVTRDSILLDDLKKMDDFFDLAKDYSLFIEDKIVHSETIAFDNGAVALEVSLLNTAPLSTFEPDDKQLHYVPDKAIQSLKKEADANIRIVLMHHGLEWFEDESKLRMEQCLYANCDFVFIGHEHNSFSEKYCNSNGSQLKVFRGGLFSSEHYESSSFSVVMIDTTSMTLHESYYVWDRHQSLYVCHERSDEQLILKHPNYLLPDARYSDAIINAKNSFGIPIKDIFVFPGLKTDIHVEEELNKAIDIEADLHKLILDRRLVCIIGGKNAGKTTLLKQLYKWSMDEGLSPLYLGQDNSTPSFSKLLNDLVGEQYGDNDSKKSMYMQIAKQQKILLIDDFDKLKKNLSDDKFLQTVLDDVEHVVFTCSQTIDGNILDRVKAELGSDTFVVSFKIKGFYKDHRDELIERFCIAQGAASYAFESIIPIIDKSVHSHRELCDLNPEFIIQNAKYYLDKGVLERADEAPFSIIFEMNIVRQLEGSVGHPYGKSKERAVKEALILLGEIAYRMHSNKVDKLSIEEVSEVVQGYSRDYGLSIETGTLIKMFERAGICELDDMTAKLRFSSDNYLAYFIAKKINLNMNKSINVDLDIQYLIDNVCFSINENILLFLSYLRDSRDFPLNLCTAAEDALEGGLRFSFDKKTVRFLSPGFDSPIKMVSDKSRAETARSISKREEAEDEDSLVYKSVYEYDEVDSTTVENRVLRSVKYLEMVGKSLMSQYVVMDAASKELVIEDLFELPNKALYFMLHDVDEKFDLIVDDLLDLLSGDDSIEGLSRSKVEEALVRLSLGLCLSLYDQIAYSCSNVDTIELLMKRPATDTNERIQQLLMAESALPSEEFINLATRQMDLAKKTNNRFEIISIRLIVNKHLLQHRGLKFELIQKAAAKIFDEKNYSNLIAANRKKEQIIP